MSKERDPDVAKMTADLGVLSDLTKKAAEDIRRVLNTPMELASEISGAIGMFGLLQKISSQLLVGSGLMFQAMRDGLERANEKIENDDLLWVCLMAYEAEKEDADAEGFIGRVQGHFKRLTGRECDLPNWWKQEAKLATKHA